jgi:hypothetical protein
MAQLHDATARDPFRHWEHDDEQEMSGFLPPDAGRTISAPERKAPRIPRQHYRPSPLVSPVFRYIVIAIVGLVCVVAIVHLGTLASQVSL